ncbi:MAG: hypothetical protein M1812_001300 [Candelaria pacifica]|nr:MAG: hypothetical protein M1812_001300 [Candelaria pacifica]
MSNPTPSLQSIPPEIRLIIWGYLLISDRPIEMRLQSLGLTTKQHYKLQPAIISTCKLFSREASNILYADNCFRFDRSETTLLPRVLAQIGAFNQSMIRTVTIVINANAEPTKEKLTTRWIEVTNMILRLTPRDHGLQTLHIELSPLQILYDNDTWYGQSSWDHSYESAKDFDAAIQSAIQSPLHSALQVALLDVLNKTGRSESARSTGGSVSTGAIPTDFVTDAFELATVTWKENSGAKSLPTRV